MDFVAIDVETANSDLASICQIGVVSYSNGTPQRTWQCLVNPEDYFDPTNEAIHGITADMVKDSPTLAECHSELDGLLERQVVIHHTSFDRVALKRGAEKYRLPEFRCRWLDSARVVRRAWKECAERGYGLAPVAKMLGISFRHHDALEDARAAGEIFVRAIVESGMGVDEWLVRVEQPICLDGFIGRSSHGTSVAQAGNPSGPLFGEVVVFTGRLSMVRAEAAAVAAQAGCEVDDRVTKATTLLVVGDQDVRVLNGKDKSSKHRKAEDLIKRGQDLRILAESDFKSLVSMGGD